MKKYLFLLLAFVGLSVSAQSYETKNALFYGDSEITQIGKSDRAVLTFNGNKLVFTFRHSGQSFVYYYHEQTVLEKSGVMDVYKSTVEDNYIYVNPSKTIAAVYSGSRTDVFGLTPSSGYFYIMGDKGDDDEEAQGLDIDGFTKQILRAGDTPFITYKGSGKPLIMVVAGVGDGWLLPEATSGNYITKRDEILTRDFGTFTITARVTYYSNGKAEYTVITKFPDGTNIGSSVYGTVSQIKTYARAAGQATGRYKNQYGSAY